MKKKGTFAKQSFYILCACVFWACASVPEEDPGIEEPEQATVTEQTLPVENSPRVDPPSAPERVVSSLPAEPPQAEPSWERKAAPVAEIAALPLPPLPAEDAPEPGAEPAASLAPPPPVT
ncbi:MAG: hypothetical protein FWG35_03885, partial [Spirochaetaceae bacterium]|nr:hypothetical protein [Spirochaetaceae bacterium]